MYPIDLIESQIKVWLLEKTGLLIFFSTSSIIFKAGRAVQETKSASASFIFSLANVLSETGGNNEAIENYLNQIRSEYKIYLNPDLQI